MEIITTTTTAREAADITVRPEVVYLKKVTTKDLDENGHGLPIEGPARMTIEHNFDWVIFTVWMGTVMVELKVAPNIKVTIATEINK